MKQTIGNLLLVLGTVLGALSAADAKRAFRTVPVEAAQGEFLFRDLESAAAKADDLITPEVMAALRATGSERVRVRFPARPAETVPVEAARGRVLAEPVVLPGESEPFNKGRVVGETLRERAAAAGVELPTEEREDGSIRLSQDTTLPVRLRRDYYIDEPTIERLKSAGYAEVPVRVPPGFAFGEWRGRWLFALALGLMVGGALLKRVKPAGADAGDERTVQGTAALRAKLDELERGVRALVARADGMAADELHLGLDPLLTGPAYDFLEGREHIRSAHGLSAYAHVMGPWAGAERKLHRAWSAAVDDHAEEARQSLRDSLPFLEETRQAMPGAAPASPQPVA